MYSHANEIFFHHKSILFVDDLISIKDPTAIVEFIINRLNALFFLPKVLFFQFDHLQFHL